MMSSEAPEKREEEGGARLPAGMTSLDYQSLWFLFQVSTSRSASALALP